jgi:uncharacterized protein (DUF697 family)
MKREITESVKDSLRYLVDSFATVLSFDLDEHLSEEENVAKIVQQTALVCAVVAVFNPVPFLDLVVLTPIHAKMTLHIAKAKGFTITQERALEVLKEVTLAIGMSIVGAFLASAIKLVPIIGVLVFVPIVYGATWGIGNAVSAYFDGMRSGKIPSADAIKDIFKREFSRGKVQGASLRREDIDRAYRDLKAKVEERERVKAGAKAERAAAKESRKEVKDEEHAPGTSQNPVTPSRITIRERPVRKPAKTIGDDGEAPESAASASSDEEAPLPEKPPARAHAIEKTIGPEEPEPAPARPAVSVTPKAEPVKIELLKEPPAPPPAVPLAAAPAATKPNLVDELERLAKLRDLGALTPEEFDMAKKKLLSS